MTHFIFYLLAGALLAIPEVPSAGEKLTYNVNWPSGLSLGEAHFQSQRSGDTWQFDFDLQASMPGFQVDDRYSSRAAADLGSLEFQKKLKHGKRLADERLVFDRAAARVTRETVNGGKSELPNAQNARDALTFLYFLRRELAQGRLPSAQTVIWGAPYQVRLEYGGSQSVRVNDTPVQAERMVAFVKGPASEFSFELFFDRDPARTPVLVRVPLPNGVFTLELVR